MDLSGENIALLLEVTPFNPTAIVVDPLNRYVTAILFFKEFTHVLHVLPLYRTLFWFEISDSGSRIRRASLDGNNPSILVNTTDNVMGHWMTIDYTTHAIYWTDLTGQELWSYNTNGGMTLIQLFADVHPRGIDLFGDFLFISDSQGGNKIRKINITSGGSGQVIFPTFCDPNFEDSDDFPNGVKVVHSQIEMEGTQSHAIPW